MLHATFFSEEEWKLLFRLAEKSTVSPKTPYPLRKAIEYLAVLARRIQAPSDSHVGVTSVWEGLFVLFTIIEYLPFVGQGYVDERVFKKCKQLTNILVEPGNSTYTSIDGVLFSGSTTYTRGVKGTQFTEYKLMKYPEGKKQQTYEVPQGVTHIHMYAFANQQHIKKLVLPESVSEIGEGAFSGCHNDLVLVCHENSFAHKNAIENRLTYELH